MTEAFNPYVGLRPFGPSEASCFFGREVEARDLARLVAIEQVTVLYGASGAGKSSLIHARLIPALQGEGYVVLPVGRVGGELPVGVAHVDNIFVFNLLLSLDEEGNPGRLAQMTLRDFLTARVSNQLLVLIIDQFEEIMSSQPGRWREREDFFRQLSQALTAHPNLAVLLVMREDYIADLDSYASLLPGRLRSRFLLPRMGVTAALEAIRNPAELAGRPFAEGVAEQLVEDLRQVRIPGQEAAIAGQYVEPVQLQVICYRLWENIKQRPAGLITAADVGTASNVERALTQFYEDTLTAALADPAATGVSEQQLRTWFDRELITEAGTRASVHQGDLMTGSLPNGVVQALQDRFLARGEARGGDLWIELAHDRLVEPIRASNAVWFAQHQSVLLRQAALWEEQGRPDGLLLTGGALVEAEQWAFGHESELGQSERAFLTAGLKARAEAARERQQGRRIRMLAIVAAAVAVVAVVAAYSALVSQQQATTAKTTALAAEALARAEQSLALAQRGTAEAASTQVVVALAIAQAANTAQVQAMQDLEAVLQTNLTALALSATPPTATPLPTSLASPTEPPVTPTFALSPTPTVSGATPRPTATATPRPTAIAKRTSTPTPSSTSNPLVIAQQTQLAGVRATQTALAVALPSERILFVSNRDNSRGDIHIMQSDGKNVTRLTDTTAYEPSYTEASDGQIVYTSKPGERVSIYRSPVSRKSVINLTGFDSDNWEPTFSKNGQWIAFVSSRDLLDWEIYTMNSDGSGIRRLTNDDPARNTMPAWSPDDAQIAFITVEGCDRPTCPSALRVMASDGTDVRRLVYFRGKVIMYPAWSPDGQLIAFASDRDGNMDIFTTDASGTNLRNLTRSPSDENFPAWSLDGQWIAFTRYTDNTEIFIMTATGSRVTQMTNHPSSDWYPVWVR